MGKCIYCGKDAGWFSSSHKECETKHEIGKKDFKDLLTKYFSQNITIQDFVQFKNSISRDSFLTDADICNITGDSIINFTQNLRKPYPPISLKLIDELFQFGGISVNKVNENGCVDQFTQKLIKGFMVDYFKGLIPFSTAHSRCQKVLSKLPMSNGNIEDAYLYVLDKAATIFLKNGVISDSEQVLIDDYINALSLPINNLPLKYQNSEICKLSQIALLKNIQKGIVPSSGTTAPIILGKNEAIYWTYNGVSLYQEKITKEWVGRHGGFSFKVVKGVYYRTGQSKGHPVEHSSMEHQGIGNLYVTNKNLIFYSPAKSVKIPYNKIVGITPYVDGIEIHKDGANQTRMTMQGFDPWFLMNVIQLIVV